MRLLTSIVLAGCALAIGAAPPASAGHAARFDPAPAWPLCGRITEAPPPSWTEAAGCPRQRWGDAAWSDHPISSTFGPRRLPSQRYRYDFHRGIDLATREGTPIFSIADGVVRLAGPHPAYRDPLIEVRHTRPGHRSCASGDGCYFSDYLHVSDWVVRPGQRVAKGELIGFTGKSYSGFPHLHFEIRDATADDPLSSWQRDAVHPLHVLPHRNAPGDVSVAIEEVWHEDGRLRVRAAVTQQSSALDLKRVRVRVLERGRSRAREVPQPGDRPDPHGYHVHPPWFDVDVWNREYTHKDSRDVPWDSFGEGGERRCPYAEAHGPGYDPNVHLDAAAPDEYRRGRANGVELAPEHFNARIASFVQRFTFHELVGPDDPAATRVVVEVENLGGKVVTASRDLEPERLSPRAAFPLPSGALAALGGLAALGLLAWLVRRLPARRSVS